MNTVIHVRTRKLVPGFIFLAIFVMMSVFLFLNAPLPASAHVGATLHSTCGKAVIDGQINSSEWSAAATSTFQMVTSSPVPLTATLYVMNSRNSLYIGIAINDDEFTTIGQYMPQGDGFRIDFDNDHSGVLKALNDDVLSIHAGLPQFEESYIYNTSGSAQSDTEGGGTENGLGAASRVTTLNHFELKHPLCSGDTLDFCLNPATANTVGFRLEYLDTYGFENPPESHFYPGTENTSEADIFIANCLVPDYSVHLPMITR